MTPLPDVRARALRRTLRLSVLDAMAYALMVGIGEAYFLADAIRLGASTFELGLLVGLPLCAGGIGPVLALRLLPLLRARRPFVAGAALGQAFLLGGLAVADLRGVLGPTSLIAIVVLYQVCGQAAGTTWSSWMGDLVPARIRGRFFARRTRAAHAATCLGLVVGGLALQRLEPGAALEDGAGSIGGGGFALLFACAALCRTASAGFLLASSEPTFHGLPGRVRVLHYLRSARGTVAWRLLLLIAALHFVVYLASPYFGPFQLEELSFSYAEYMLASVAVVLAKIALLPAWGSAIDRHGARSLFVLAAVLVALIPLPWLWAGGLGWVLVAQAFSGFSWAGLDLAQFTLLLESSYRRTRLHVFAAQSVVNGSAQLLGGLTGAWLTGLLDGRRALFGISLVARLAVALSFTRLLPEARMAGTVRTRDLLLRVIGLRPSGVAYRPAILDPGDTSDSASRSATEARD